jgi:meso-butanediol dehydrogenase/(S,S)-butanediol dehydrogenase/diacetyl reductase
MSQPGSPSSPAGTLTGRVALVTGAGQGNGRAIALRLAREGADVAVNDLRGDAARSTSDEIASVGRRSIAIEADVADVAQISAMIDRVKRELGALHILVNNAGIIRPSPFGRVSEDDWDQTMRLNTRGVFFCSQEAARVMEGGSVIINIASVAGRGAPTLSPPYAASKAALINLTQNLARALAASQIRVNSVCPGIIDTDFNARLDQLLGVEQQGMAPGEFLRQRVAGVPLKRIGTPEDVAGAVVFLAGPDAAYITGQSLNVDGGLVFS